MGSGSACAESLAKLSGVYIQMSADRSALSPLKLLLQINALVLKRAPQRVDPDQPNALSLASAGGRNLDACACFSGSTWRGNHGLSYELLCMWVF